MNQNKYIKYQEEKYLLFVSKKVDYSIYKKDNYDINNRYKSKLNYGVNSMSNAKEKGLFEPTYYRSMIEAM